MLDETGLEAGFPRFRIDPRSATLSFPSLSPFIGWRKEKMDGSGLEPELLANCDIVSVI